MTLLEELKYKRKGSLIVVCTLGLAGAFQIQSIGDIWRSNVFEDTSVSKNEGLSFIFKCVSFVLLTLLLAIPMFVIHFLKLIYYQIEISKLTP
ncbi:MAG: hypothetical protein FWC34_00115 [Bacteroidetes bacterium]|nr:hypothetical protein [Bacteroidota bacterium]